MNYMKLVKLMYLVDRAALINWGRPVTFDSYFSMENGPVLSRTLDLIDEGCEHESPWGNLIVRTASDPYAVTLRSDQNPTDELSEVEEELVDQVYEQFGRMNRWRLVDLLHDILPEWRDPHGSSVPISYRDILMAAKKSEQEIAEIEFEMEGLAFIDALAASNLATTNG